MSDTISPDQSLTDLHQIPASLATQFIDHLVRFRRLHAGRIHVVKPSGDIIDKPHLRRDFAREVVRLSRDFGLQVAVIHGAGVQINRALKDAGIVPSMDPVTKLRISHADQIEIIDRTTLEVNEQLCREIDEAGEGFVHAHGMAGHHPDLNMVSKPISIDEDNFSGEKVLSMSTGVLKSKLRDETVIPVITNMCQIHTPVRGVTKINVNADTVANALATHLGAYRLYLCGKVPGVLESMTGQQYEYKKMEYEEIAELVRSGKVRIVPEVKPDEVEALKQRGLIDGGMEVKVKEAFEVAGRMGQGGAVVILDHNFSVETLTPRGSGTIFRALTV